MTNLERLYEQASRDGIAVENFPLPQNASIALEIDGKYYIGIDPKRFDTRTEEAECLAHEIGHCQTKSLYPIGETCRRRYERRAEVWAITRLIPQKRFLHAIRQGCREVWEFAEELGTSYAFAEKVVAYYLAKLSNNPAKRSSL